MVASNGLHSAPRRRRSRAKFLRQKSNTSCRDERRICTTLPFALKWPFGAMCTPMDRRAWTSNETGPDRRCGCLKGGPWLDGGSPSTH
eukprot:10752550-Alexandrium_andersonii.AAC.1